MKPFLSRRQALQEAALGFGGLALTSMIARAAETPTYSLRPRQPHFPANAKNVIFIYVGGGPSTIDMFDPKPLLRKFDGQPAPFEIKGRALNGSQEVMASPWEFTRSGRSGREISNLLPYFQKVVDKVSFVRSMQTDRIDHSTAQFTFVTGRGFTGFPTLGSWVNYALGTENQNLPGLCQYIDRGMSALLTDLDQRGLLADTLVVWSGEFGRLPTIESKNATPGRDHNPYGFSMWMAGAGVKQGFDFGQTDELGYAAVPEFRVGHADIHATIQHLLGLDHQKNTFFYEGRNESLVGVTPARVLKEILL